MGDYSGCLGFERIQTQLFLCRCAAEPSRFRSLTGVLVETRTGKILEHELTRSGKLESDAPALGA